MLFNLKQFELLVSTAHSVLLRQVRVHFLVYTLDYFYLVPLKFRDLRVKDLVFTISRKNWCLNASFNFSILLSW